MEKEIRVLVKEPGKAPEIRTIQNTLEAMQGIVGGYIETMTFATDCALVVNEEGTLQCLEPNFWFVGDLIVGTAFFVGVAGEDFCGLTDDLLNILKEWVGMPRSGDYAEL